MDAEEIMKITGEIYDLCRVLDHALAGEPDALSKGARMIVQQIRDKNPYVNMQAYSASRNPHYRSGLRIVPADNVDTRLAG